MGNTMRMEQRKLVDLKPAEYNPRIPLQPEDKEYQDIKRSIEDNGYLDPIVINYDGTIIKGHQRRTVMMDLGIKEAEVVVLNIRDKNKEKQANIALNKITGRWDDLKLKDLLLDLDLNGYDLESTGFNMGELENLCVDLEQDIEAEEDDFDSDEQYESIKEPTTKRGDIWLLGKHRLMCGDSTSTNDVSKLMAGEETDLVITDPPYNIDYGKKTRFLKEYGQNRNCREDILNDKMEDEDFLEFLQAFYDSAKSVMRPGAVIYVFHPDSLGEFFRGTMRRAGLKLSQCLIWEKNQFVLGRNDYQWIHEPILYGWKEGAGHYFIDNRTKITTIAPDEEPDLESMSKKDLITYISEFQESFQNGTSIIRENKPQKSKLHPTMKPVSLIGTLMKNSSKPNWKVTDFFGGSGSTLMAAEQLGRRAFLMEMDEKYCDVIVKRWEEYTGEKAILQTEIGLNLES